MNEFCDLSLNEYSDKISAAAGSIMGSAGWTNLEANTYDGNPKYLYTRLQTNQKDTATGMGRQDQVGDMRIKWEFVQCCQINVIA